MPSTSPATLDRILQPILSLLECRALQQRASGSRRLSLADGSLDQKSTLLDVPRASPFLRDCQSCSDKTSRAVNFDFLLLLRDML
ncbi:hypothetical protein N7450_011732 [Penicillium hetheringtonii]|uniref:Uncharacterized protein n=1 Tax=Penicillium hetheringtonii TaxID=911720 RepID=A0AAD6DAH6_9EURO|nr:hypothetical protein N7450_011732 [Penicillium hetheringtonii]